MKRAGMKRHSRTGLLRLGSRIGLVAALSFASAAFGQPASSACGPLANAYGPFDYREVRGPKLDIVEGAHFTSEVEALLRGNRGYLGGDLDYTLRAFPNHHRALVSMMRYGEKTKSPQPRDVRYPVECYFTRAIRFRPDDVIVRMIYAAFLQKAGRNDEANAQLAEASELAKDNAFTHYNIGLIYLDAKDYANALRQAHRAYALGFPRTELKERLQAAGQWREPVAKPPAGSAPAAAASAAAK